MDAIICIPESWSSVTYASFLPRLRTMKTVTARAPVLLYSPVELRPTSHGLLPDSDRLRPPVSHAALAHQLDSLPLLTPECYKTLAAPRP